MPGASGMRSNCKTRLWWIWELLGGNRLWQGAMQTWGAVRDLRAWLCTATSLSR